MRRAIQLARNGQFFASPNPMVGAVIVHNDKIIGEGFHRRCGEGHAEVNAVASVANPKLLPYSTIYVTLEPCPMCAWAISMSGISTVYFGSYNQQYGALESQVQLPLNPNLKVYGGIMEEECNKILQEFFEGIRK